MQDRQVRHAEDGIEAIERPMMNRRTAHHRPSGDRTTNVLADLYDKRKIGSWESLNFQTPPVPRLLPNVDSLSIG